MAVRAIGDVASGYTNLEYDLAAGQRGSRLLHARALLCELTGAADALVVNNCAAALVLALRGLAHGRDVVVSRGELMEIGGSFRVPDIMQEAGVRLAEVGTTNRTHLDDYRRAVTPSTGAIVKVHRSNFTMAGFVASVTVRELARLAAEVAVPLVHDFGSGLMLDLAPWGLRGEPTVRDAVSDGADIVVISGDKLLGGPQAGILLGSRDAMAMLRAHPLARALRVDKLTLAALEATLALYRDPRLAVTDIPVLAMLTAPADAVRAHATELGARLDALGIAHTITPSVGAIGGGAFPDATLPSWGIALAGDAQAWERALRDAPTPVIGRSVDAALHLDVRTVLHDDDDALVDSIAAAREGAGAPRA